MTAGGVSLPLPVFQVKAVPAEVKYPAEIIPAWGCIIDLPPVMNDNECHGRACLRRGLDGITLQRKYQTSALCIPRGVRR